MKRILEGDVRHLPALEGRWAVTLGTFDGVHRGHQAILGQVRRIGRWPGFAGACAVTFQVHPRRVLDPSSSPPLLSTTTEKIQLLAASGLDVLVILEFDEDLASMDYDLFVRRILRQRLGMAHLVLGHDVHFGRQRRGSVRTVMDLAESEGFGFSQVASVRDENEPISSTRIRELLGNGRWDPALRLLGHPYPLHGQVVEGRQLGRRLGFPTANVQPEEPSKLLPAGGVHAGWARKIGSPWWPAVMNIGHAPSVQGGTATPRVEVHILGGVDPGELGGQRLEVAVAVRLRDERRFPDLESLRAQIAQDVREAGEQIAVVSNYLRPERLATLPENGTLAQDLPFNGLDRPLGHG